MKKRGSAVLALLIPAICLGVACGPGTQVESPTPPEKAKAPAPAPTPEEMMAAYATAGTPGPNHAWLASLEGSWRVETKAWMGPGDPQLSKGTAAMKMVLGGRFLEQRYEAIFMDQPFSGIGYSGFDNTQGKFFSTWMDSTSTHLYTEEGALDATGKVLTTTSQHPDPVTGKMVKGRSTNTFVDPDTYVVEMFEPGPDGKEMRVLQLTYTRVKN